MGFKVTEEHRNVRTVGFDDVTGKEYGFVIEQDEYGYRINVYDRVYGGWGFNFFHAGHDGRGDAQATVDRWVEDWAVEIMEAG